MAIHQSGSATTYYSRATNLPPIASFTMMGRFYPTSFPDNTEQVFFVNGQIGPNQAVSARIRNPSTQGLIQTLVGTTETNGPALTVNRWIHVALVVEGTGAGQVFLYLDGVKVVTAAGSAAPVAGAIEILGNSTGAQYFIGRSEALKMWDRPLSQSEVQCEMRQLAPVSWDRLNSFFPLDCTAMDEVDRAFGRNLTVNGTGFSTQAGSGLPWTYRSTLRRWARIVNTAAGGGGGGTFTKITGYPFGLAGGRGLAA